MNIKNSFRLAAIQAAPVYFDRDASTEKACALIKEAGAKGATIAAFGETWLPGYPFFMYAQTQPLTFKALAEYIASAVEVPSPTTDKLCAAAKAAGVDVVIGIVDASRWPKGPCIARCYSSVGTVAFSDATARSSQPSSNGPLGAKAMRRACACTKDRMGASAVSTAGSTT